MRASPRVDWVKGRGFGGRLGIGLDEPLELDSAEVESHARDVVQGAVGRGLATTDPRRTQVRGSFIKYLVPLCRLA